MWGVPIERLCIHQLTLMQCGFAESLECLVRHHIPMTAIWHEKLDEVGVVAARRALSATGIKPGALCIGGTMSTRDLTRRAEQIELTHRRIDACSLHLWHGLR